MKSARARYDTYTEKPGYSWDADLAFADVKPAEYVALVVPGGRASEYIRNDGALQRIIRHFFEQKKPVAHLCHAALVLAVAGVLKGRRIAAYPALEPDVRAAGAEFVDSEAGSTDRWCRHVPGPITLRGCASLSECCEKRRR
jgi:protease I